LSNSVVPGLSGETVGTLSATGSNLGTNLKFALVTGAADNSLFDINSSGQLVTKTGFPDGTRTSYTVKVHVSNTDYPDLSADQTLSVSAVLAPTDITLSTTTFRPIVGNTGATFSTVADGTGRSFKYSLVTGDGTNDADNGLFDIDSSGQLVIK